MKTTTPRRVLESIGKGPCLSIEVVPPARGGDLEGILSAVESIAAHDLAFVSVTDHPGGKAWADSDNGPARVALRTKPGTLGTAVALRDAFGITAVPHIVGAMADPLAVEDLLIDLHYANFRDVFVVMGDDRYAPSALGRRHAPAETYDHAVDVVSHIARLNRGEYTPPAEGKPTAFTVGVAAYPEKHFAAPNLDSDIGHLAAKIRAGASFAITQMVFDAQPYANMLRRLRELGVDVPVIPGIKPILKASSIESIPRNFFLDLPQEFVRAMEDARSPAQERAVGIDWAVRLCRDLLDAGAPGLHFFTMGRGAATRAVLDALVGNPQGSIR